MRRFSSALLASAASIGLGLAGLVATPGMALANTQTICPATSFTNASTTPPNCNLVITFASDGSISTTIPTGATANYDGTEDALIGVINNSGSTIYNFNVSNPGVAIFGFEIRRNRHLHQCWTGDRKP